MSMGDMRNMKDKGNVRDMSDQEMIQCLKVMADPIRYAILNMLQERPAHSYEFLEGLSITQPTLSHHMKVLRESGLVTVTQEPRWKTYALNEIKFGLFLRQLESLLK